MMRTCRKRTALPKPACGRIEAAASGHNRHPSRRQLACSRDRT
jgi:hypothetical protein